jgi:hypothetical protein
MTTKEKSSTACSKYGREQNPYRALMRHPTEDHSQDADIIEGQYRNEF